MFIRKLVPGRKTFVLCVGAQKAATTWLHGYLNSFENVDFGTAKEYHIFDAITMESCSGFQRKVEKRLSAAISGGYEAWKLNPAVKRMAFMSDPELYFAYFHYLLHRDGISITGDFSPSYSGLSADTLVYINEEFGRLDVDVRPLFILREPVSRLQSSARMKFRARGVKPSYDEELDMMRKLLGSTEDMTRSSYDYTISTLDSVFGSKVFYGFYETLFTKDTIKTLCRFLNLRYQPAQFSKKMNVSPSDNELTEEHRAEFAAAYRSVYEFCSSYFGRDVIEPIWQGPTGSTPS